MEISNITNSDRSEVLVQALPYIQKYQNKTVVIKYGGNAMVNEELQDAVMTDIVLLRSVGVNIVLVHGGGPEISDMLKRVGKQSRFVDGLRYTDEETIDIVQMVLAGKVNKHLVQLISKHGGKAIGLCGIDGEMMKAVKYTKSDVGFVGEITEIDTDVIDYTLEINIYPLSHRCNGRERRGVQYKRRYRRGGNSRKSPRGKAFAYDRHQRTFNG